jgi:GDP-D-mannose dehydratase
VSTALIFGVTGQMALTAENNAREGYSVHGTVRRATLQYRADDHIYKDPAST